MSMLDDLRNLDRNNVGNWPKAIKTFFAILVFLFIVVMGYFFWVSDQRDQLESVEKQEETLKTDFMAKQAKVVNLEIYKKQLADTKDMLQQMLRQLPSKTEMPDLLVDISQTALSAGIENQLFQPGPEAVKEFYAEKPIQLRMLGTYHQFGSFISGVASLPRVVILTMHDVSLSPTPGDARSGMRGGQLTLEGTVKTYRYLDDEEAVAAETASPKGGK